jgi:hypothetical protein
LAFAARSYKAPVGQLEMHWPHSSHVESFKGMSNAVLTSMLAALPLNVKALSA